MDGLCSGEGFGKRIIGKYSVISIQCSESTGEEAQSKTIQSLPLATGSRHGKARQWPQSSFIARSKLKGQWPLVPAR
jgi:hypothetical protein